MENKSNSKIVLGIIVGLIIGGIVSGVGTYFIMNNKSSDKSTVVEDKKENNQVNENVVENNGISGQYYLFGDTIEKRRYYLALDNTDISVGKKDENKKVYLVDMNLSASQPTIKEINLMELFKSFYDKKINDLPTILAEGTTNEMPKSNCESYSIQYGDAREAYMSDWTKGVAFTVNYSCVFKNGTAAMGLGSEIYYLNVDTMKVTFVTSKN